MKTDWHRYNLKRRVAQLPSILSEVFAEKVLEQQKQSEEEENDEDEYGFHVNTRKKQNKGERQVTKKELRQLLRDENRRVGRHLEATGVQMRSQSPALSVASEFSEFSLGESEHLSEVDSRFDTASEIDYSDGTHSDWSSLHESDEDSEEYDTEEEYADAGVELPNHYCFYCGKNNEEIEQNIRHMSHQHGLYIPERSFLSDLEGLLTFVNEVITLDHECLTCGFQGKSLESIRQHMQSKGHCRIPYESKEEKRVIHEFYDFSVDEVPAKKRLDKKVSFGPASDESEYEIVDVHDEPQFDLDAVEMTLPTGSKVGHRSMVRYHRQNLPVAREYPEATKTVALVDRRFAPGITAQQLTKQQREVKRLENKAKNIHQRMTKASRVNYQQHYRDTLLGVL